MIILANTELSTFLGQASTYIPGNGHPDKIMFAIEDRLPSIADAIEKAGSVIGPSTPADNLDPELKAQLDLYAENLRKLKSLLSCLLVSTEARQARLASNAGKARETLSWLRTLKSTQID